MNAIRLAVLLLITGCASGPLTSREEQPCMPAVFKDQRTGWYKCRCKTTNNKVVYTRTGYVRDTYKGCFGKEHPDIKVREWERWYLLKNKEIGDAVMNGQVIP